MAASTFTTRPCPPCPTLPPWQRTKRRFCSRKPRGSPTSPCESPIRADKPCSRYFHLRSTPHVHEAGLAGALDDRADRLTQRRDVGARRGVAEREPQRAAG